MKTLLCLLLLAFVAGCSTDPVQEPPTNAQAIILKNAQTREIPSVAFYGMGSVVVPAGVYEPDFQAKDGIYYHANVHLIFNQSGLHLVRRGGIFIPNPLTEKEKLALETEKSNVPSEPHGPISKSPPISEPQPASERDMRMGVWFDQQEEFGNAIIFALTSPTRIYRVSQPFEIQTQTNN